MNLARAHELGWPIPDPRDLPEYETEAIREREENARRTLTESRREMREDYLNWPTL